MLGSFVIGWALVVSCGGVRAPRSHGPCAGCKCRNPLEEAECISGVRACVPSSCESVTQRTRILYRGVDGGRRKRIWAEGSRRKVGATARLRMPDGVKGTAGEVTWG